MAPSVDDVENDEQDEPSRIISVLADSSRKSRWTISRRTSMINVFARSYFDFRHVEVDGDTVEITIICLLGTITFVVPEGTDVELSGVSFLASATSEVAAPGDDPVLPRLIVNANTLFGRMRVRTPNDAERGLLAAPEAPAAAESGASDDGTVAGADHADGDAAIPAPTGTNDLVGVPV